MIVQITGELAAVSKTSAHVQVNNGLTYEVVLPAYTAVQLAASVGQPITLHTLYFIESQSQGVTMFPRLAGFVTAEDRRFYELFTTCKGIGNRKALRAMTLDTQRIAAAIVDRDVALLQTLPEIGKRTAETIVTTLHDKLDDIVSAAAYPPTGVSSQTEGETRTVAREALEVLLTLGENRTDAINWIDQALRGEDDHPDDAEALVAKVYRIKSSV